jgi:lysophospholipase
MPGWAQGRLRVVDGAEHELLMETPATRAALTEEIVALFLANG